MTVRGRTLIVAGMNTPTFTLNGRSVALAAIDPQESLLRWLRREALHGTKEGCGDGDCGACTVALVEIDADGRSHYRAVNSCLLPMGALAGRTLVTVEGLADGQTLHPVQQALVDTAGSQCGYCTPGFVMSLFVGWYTRELGDHAIEGNLCRCTGYRPIRDAAQRLAQQAPPTDDRHQQLLASAPPTSASALPGWHNPLTLAEALALKAAHPQAQWIAGATDVGVALSRGTRAAHWIALDRIAELKTLQVGAEQVRIGAGVALARLEHELAGVFPALDQLLPWFAARQVKNRATLGGNLGSASPIGDLLPWLLAHDAVIEVRSAGRTRRIAVADYFLDYRKTALAGDELIVAVEVPRHRGPQAAYKVAKRQTDDISIVCAVYTLALSQGRVSHARLAYGGVAAIPARARATEAWLIGRALDVDTVTEACQRLAAEFHPLSDHRASAEYRRDLIGSLFRRFIDEQVQP